MALFDAPALSHYLVLGAILFAIAMAGIFLNRKNVIILLMAIELMLLAVNMNFIAFSSFMDDMAGQVFVFFILTVAAAFRWRRSPGRSRSGCSAPSSGADSRTGCASWASPSRLSPRSSCGAT